MTGAAASHSWYARHKAQVRAAVDRWQHENPEKRRAHKIVEAAKLRGALVPQPCEVCGSTNRIEAHHEDYSQPLAVTWLCRSCHRQADKTRREIDAAIYGSAA